MVSFSNQVFPASLFTAVGTGTVIDLAPNTAGANGSYSAGLIAAVGTGLTTATFAVQGSSDGGQNYFTLNTYPVGSSTGSTSQTVTANGYFYVDLAAITHVRFVVSGTFTATSLSLTLTGSPNGSFPGVTGGGGGGGVTSFNTRTGAVTSQTGDYSFSQISGSVAASQMPALTGDVTSSAGTTATTLATSGVTAGTYGSATNTAGTAPVIPSVTFDAKGRATSASGTTIGVAASYPVGTSGTVVPLLSTANTWVTGQVLSGTTSVSTLQGGGGITSITWSSTSITLAHNAADANPAVIVNQVNASSTGNIENWQLAGTTLMSLSYQGVLAKSSANGLSRSSIVDTGALSTGGTTTTTTPHWYINPGNNTAPTTWLTGGTLLGMNAPSGFGGAFISCHTNGGVPVVELWSDGSVRWGNGGSTWFNVGGVGVQSNKMIGSMSAVGGFNAPLYTPASSSATGTAGTIAWDANFIYICTAANTWVRVATASF